MEDENRLVHYLSSLIREMVIGNGYYVLEEGTVFTECGLVSPMKAWTSDEIEYVTCEDCLKDE